MRVGLCSLDLKWFASLANSRLWFSLLFIHDLHTFAQSGNIYITTVKLA